MHLEVQGPKETDACNPENSAGQAKSKIALTGNDVHFFSDRPFVSGVTLTTTSSAEAMVTWQCG